MRSKEAMREVLLFGYVLWGTPEETGFFPGVLLVLVYVEATREGFDACKLQMLSSRYQA